MKKKIIFGIIFSAIMAINVVSVFKSDDSNLSLMRIMQISQASGAEITGHFTDGWCTCKNGVCQDGNWIGFRHTCGDGDSDGACSYNTGC